MCKTLSLYISDKPSTDCREVSDFCDALRRRGFELDFDPERPREGSIALSIGGDGTFLRAARKIGRAGVPLLGVNAGHLGFMTQYTLGEADLLATHILDGQLSEETRMLLHVEGCHIPDEVWPYALNDITVLKADSSSMIEVDIHERGEHIADCLADGLIVATPTGSTAYSLSAGGPIMEPRMEAVSLVPVAPHTLTLRPMVLSADVSLQLTAISRSGRCLLSVDGCSFPLTTPCRLSIERAPFGLRLLRRPDESFFSTLRKKLHWSQR